MPASPGSPWGASCGASLPTRPAPEPPDEWKAKIAKLEEQEKAEAEARAVAGGVEEEDRPVRLRFSPGFITILSAGFLSFVIGWWSLLAVVLPLLAFVAITRTGQETAGDAVRRFFQADDLPYSDVEAPEASEALTVADAQAEADQFAKEAETGAHGGMGLGDAKLALAIGAALGPFPAMLSLFVATFIGAITGLALKRIYNKPNLRYGLPFVPFMAAGALIVMLYGQQLVDWYRGLLPSSAPRPSRRPPPG
jgi:prepilin signal peptidase PulO-like enzyme (type II secretory pathway)